MPGALLFAPNILDNNIIDNNCFEREEREFDIDIFKGEEENRCTIINNST